MSRAKHSEAAILLAPILQLVIEILRISETADEDDHLSLLGSLLEVLGGTAQPLQFLLCWHITISLLSLSLQKTLDLADGGLLETLHFINNLYA